MEELIFKLRNFANGLGLHFFVSEENSSGDVEIEFVRNEDNKILQYMIQKYAVGDDTYVKIITAVTRTFVGVVEEETMTESVKVCEDSVQMVGICGLSKNEYIALELTKAWASQRKTLDYLSGSDMVDCYHEMLEEVEKYGSNQSSREEMDGKICL